MTKLSPAALSLCAKLHTPKPRKPKLIDKWGRPKYTGPGMSGELFYKTAEWQAVRYEVLKENAARHSDGKPHCVTCGVCPPKAIMHCDHRKPRSLFPSLELVKSNLDVKCEGCNLGKGATL